MVLNKNKVVVDKLNELAFQMVYLRAKMDAGDKGDMSLLIKQLDELISTLKNQGDCVCEDDFAEEEYYQALLENRFRGTIKQ